MNRSNDQSTLRSALSLCVAVAALLLSGTVAAGPAAAVPSPTPPSAPADVAGSTPAVPSGPESEPTPDAVTPQQSSAPTPPLSADPESSPAASTSPVRQGAGGAQTDGYEETRRTTHGDQATERSVGAGSEEQPTSSNPNGFAVDPATGYYIHGRTGYLIVPQSGQMLTPGSLADTGYKYSFISGRVLYANPETAGPSPVSSPSTSASARPTAEEDAAVRSSDTTPSAAAPSPAAGDVSTASPSAETPSAASATRTVERSFVQPLMNIGVAVVVAVVAVLYYVKVFRRPARKAKP